MPSDLKSPVLIDDARKSNPQYLLIMENMFKEQAARVFQRQYRLTYHISQKSNSYKETLSGKLTMGFIKESMDKTYMIHAQKIKNNKWLHLDFKAPEFESSLYKALRLSTITVDDMVTAQLLFHASDLFKEVHGFFNLRQHHYEEKGPYHPSQISYATKENIEKFYSDLKNLPLHQQNYFSIDFSKRYEYVFLHGGIQRDDCFSQPRFVDFIKKYFAKAKLTKLEHHKILEEIENLKIPGANYYAAQELCAWLEKLNPELEAFNAHKHTATDKPSDRELRESPRLLLALIGTEVQNPDVALSPAYDVSNPDSPLLCRIIPTVGSLQLLQTAVHGKDTTKIIYTAGQISPSLIRKLDEDQQARPVELTHPDLLRNQQPHGLYVHSFELTMHDLYHSWSNSALVAKPYIRYVREVLSKTDYYMSKKIWELSDMDYAGSGARLELKATGAWSDRLRWSLQILKFNYNKKTYQGLANDDLNLLIILDMVLHPSQWKLFLGEFPEKIFSHSTSHELAYDFKTIYNFFSTLNKNCILKDDKNTTLFAIIAFRIRHQSDSELLRRLNQANLQQQLDWTRNEGIFIKKAYQSQNQACVRKIPPEILNELCGSWVKNTASADKSVISIKKTSIKVDPEQKPIALTKSNFFTINPIVTAAAVGVVAAASFMTIIRKGI